MAKITLNTIASGFLSLFRLSTNFTDIQNHLNNKVLYRDNPAGEPNQMLNDLDMNSKNIQNAGTVSTGALTVGGVQFVPGAAIPVGVTTFSVGTVAAPGLAVLGDLDTGLYSPAANTLSAAVQGAEAWRAAPGGMTFSLPITGLGATFDATQVDSLVSLGNITIQTGGLTVQAGGANITGGLTAAGAISLPAFTLTNGTLATTQAALDNSTKVATTAYTDAAVAAGGAVSGRVLQRVYAELTAETAVVAPTPQDGTPPLVTEGTALLSASITCSNAANKIRATFVAPYFLSGGGNSANGSFHMHKDSDATFCAQRVGFSMIGGSTNTHEHTVVLRREIAAGSTVPITISVRAGTGTGTFTVCRDDVFGNTCNIGTLVLEEIKA